MNAALDAVNRKAFFGEPLTVTISDAVKPEEARALLSGSSVLCVRDDVLEAPSPPDATK